MRIVCVGCFLVIASFSGCTPHAKGKAEKCFVSGCLFYGGQTEPPTPGDGTTINRNEGGGRRVRWLPQRSILTHHFTVRALNVGRREKTGVRCGSQKGAGMELSGTYRLRMTIRDQLSKNKNRNHRSPSKREFADGETCRQRNLSAHKLLASGP